MTPKGQVGASNARRRQILDAALEIFLEAGVGDCRVEDLIESAGVSVGSFYHHFGGKPGVAAALYLEVLAEFQEGFVVELNRHRSARTGIKATVRHHLAWVAECPQRAAYLFQCLEPEVQAVCREQENQMTTAFFGHCAEWMDEKAAAGQIRKLSFLEYYVLWMGPSLELTRAWLMNVQGKWTWMGTERCRPEALIGLGKNLSEAAWHALRRVKE